MNPLQPYFKYYRVKLHDLNDRQKLMVHRYAGYYRFCYNWGLNYWNSYYKIYGNKPTYEHMTSVFTGVRNSPEYKWLLDFDVGTARKAFRNLRTAFNRFFLHQCNHPKFHSKKKNDIRYPVRADRVRFMGENNRYVRIPGCGRDKDMLFDCKSHDIPVGDNIKYYNANIKFDGVDYWLSLSIEVIDPFIHIADNEPIGVDVGIRNTAVVSDGTVFSFSESESKRIKRLNHRLKKMQSCVSKDIDRRLKKASCTKTKYEDQPKSKNQLKRERKLRKTYHDIHNVYNNHYHQVSRSIANKRSKLVVIEDLKVRQVKKSHYINEKMYNPFVSLSRFLSYIEYKCRDNGSEVIRASNQFPSTQLCSKCGNIMKVGLKRVYTCPICGVSLDRDLNAAINLRNYGLKRS